MAMAACTMAALGCAPTNLSRRTSAPMRAMGSCQFPPPGGSVMISGSCSRSRDGGGRVESLTTPRRSPLCGGSRIAMVASGSASSSSPSAGEVSVATTSGGGEGREELKEKLLEAIEAADGNLNEECVSIINELAELNPNVGVLEEGGEEGRKLWVGAFAGVKANFRVSGKKGGGRAEVRYKGAPATLGRLSFNCFKPADLDVYFSDFLNEVFEDPQGGYLLVTTHTFANPRGADLPPVDGIIFSTGSYNNIGPNRQEVVFQSAVTRPRFPEKDLEVWKEVFAENAGMDERGQVSAILPDHKGQLDYLYIDEELRITRGNYGAYVVVRKLPELAPEFKP